MSGLENDKDVSTEPAMPPGSPHFFRSIGIWLTAVAAVLTVLVTIVNEGNQLIDGLRKIFAPTNDLHDVPPKPPSDMSAVAPPKPLEPPPAAPSSRTTAPPNINAKWAQVAVYGPTVRITSGGSAGGNPGCQGRAVQSCARPEHGGRLLPSSGTLVDVSSNGRVGSSVIIDSPEQICIQLWASATACETQVSIEGRTKAIEEFDLDRKNPGDAYDSAVPIPNVSVKPHEEKLIEAKSDLSSILGRWIIVDGSSGGETVVINKNAFGFEVWLSWAGQASIRKTTTAGANLQIQNQNLKCNYYVTFTSKIEMIWALRSGDRGCPQTTRFSKVTP